MALTENNCIKIKNDGRFLIATMPNGDIIPMQTKLITNNGMAKMGYVYVSVELHACIPTYEFEVAKQFEHKPYHLMFDKDSFEWQESIIQQKNKEIEDIQSKWWYKLFKKL